MAPAKKCVVCGRQAVGENSSKEPKCLGHAEWAFYGWTMYPIPRPTVIPPCIFGRQHVVCGKPSIGAGRSPNLPFLPACAEHAESASFFRPYVKQNEDG